MRCKVLNIIPPLLSSPLAADGHRGAPAAVAAVSLMDSSASSRRRDRDRQRGPWQRAPGSAAARGACSSRTTAPGGPGAELQQPGSGSRPAELRPPAIPGAELRAGMSPRQRAPGRPAGRAEPGGGRGKLHKKRRPSREPASGPEFFVRGVDIPRLCLYPPYSPPTFPTSAK